MFKNYFKTAYRNLLKFKTYTVINIFGLAIGIGAVILILLYIQFEFSFDKFHQDLNSIYRVSIVNLKNGKFESDTPVFVDPLGPAMKKDFPEVENYVRFSTPRSAYANKEQGEPIRLRNIRHADSTFFDVFSFRLLQGNPKTALVSPRSIVLTEQVAQSLFGETNPVGKSVALDGQDLYLITGVAENPPVNSTIQFEALISFSSLYSDSRYYMGWNGGNQYFTYIKLAENASPDIVESKFPDLMWRYLNKELSAIGVKYEPYLQPLKDVHLFSKHYMNERFILILILTGIAFLILFVAGVNFVNLTTARATSRMTEIGVRKVLGANRASLIKQFLTESILITFISAVIALFFVYLVFPLYQNLVSENVRFLGFRNYAHFVSLIVVILVVGIGAGSYPAFVLSRFDSSRVLKGSFKTGLGKTKFRNILVTLQFTISVALFICTMLINNQIQYMKNKQLGFNKENMLVISLSSENVQQKADVLKQEIKSLPNVINVSASSDVPYNGFTRNGYFPEGHTSPTTFHVVDVDEHFLETYQINLLKGRNFSMDFGSDQNAYLVNETLAKSLSWEEPIGKRIRRNGQHQIIGVVEDFHFSSLHDKIEPLIITNQPWRNMFSVLSVRIAGENVPDTLARIKKVYKSAVMDAPFEYYFLDQAFDYLYRSEQNFQKILLYFSYLAILIAILGLFSLSSFSIEQRTKEIGVRKVLGATSIGIAGLLSKDFLKFVAIANIIAWPVSWFIMNQWLQNYAYRISVGFGSFILAGIISLIIAQLAVSYQSFRAARANPVKSLRYE